MAWGRSAAAWSWPASLVAGAPMVVTPQAWPTRAAEIAGTYLFGLKVLERADCEALAWALYWACPRAPRCAEVHTISPTRPFERASRRLVFDRQGGDVRLPGGYNLKTGGVPDPRL